jgi:mRNA interferase MazF
MKEGNVALARLPQADKQTKIRPVIVLRAMPFPGDFLVCGVSSQLRQRVEAFDEIISPVDDDFRVSGLLKESLIRLGFLVVIPQNRIVGSIGSISTERHDHLLRKLSEYLKPRS